MNEKKYIIIGTALLVVVLILVIAFTGKDTSKPKVELSNDSDTVMENAERESAAVKDSDKKEFAYIDVNKYLELYAGEEATLVLVARPTCSYCQVAEPIIQGIMKEYNIDINYLNTDEFTDETHEQFVNSNERFADSFGTPMLLLVGNNSIIDVVDGLTDKAHYIEFFKNNGIIKE